MGSARRPGGGDHPPDGSLRAFVRAEEGVEESLGIRHHVTEARCLRCVLDLNRHLAAERRSGPPAMRVALRLEAGSEVRSNLIRQMARRAERIAYVRSAEETLAPDLLRELLLKSPAARQSAVRNAEKFKLLGLAEHLVERARDEVLEDVGRAADLGRLAVEVGEAVTPAVYGASEVATIQAKAWGALGNALRVRSEFREAERCFTIAGELLGRGHGSPPDRADLLSLTGSLRMSQTRFEEARLVLERAAVLYRSQGEGLAEARVLVQLGKALAEGGDAERAVEILERAERTLSPEPGVLVLLARQARAACLNEAGRTREARQVLESLRPEWAAQLPQFGHAQRLAWLEARILRSEGDLQAAEEAFLAVQAGWEERSEAYEYALVSLELAALYLEQGRTAEVRELAERMLTIFSAQEIHRHALAALALVQQAVAKDTATASFLRDVLRYLERARSNPELSYSPEP